MRLKLITSALTVVPIVEPSLSSNSLNYVYKTCTNRWYIQSTTVNKSQGSQQTYIYNTICTLSRVVAYPLRRWLSATTTEWMHRVGPLGSWPSMDSCDSSAPWQQVPQTMLTISPAWLPCERIETAEEAARGWRATGVGGCGYRTAMHPKRDAQRGSRNQEQ